MKSTTYMFPCSVFSNVTNSLSRHVKNCPNLFVGKTGPKPKSYIFNGTWIKFGAFNHGAHGLPTLFNFIKHVLSICSGKQMIRINTKPVVAFVTDKLFIWNFTKMNHPTNPMTISPLTIFKIKNTVSVLDRSGPIPAAACFFNSLKKSFRILHCETIAMVIVVGNLLPIPCFADYLPYPTGSGNSLVRIESFRFGGAGSDAAIQPCGSNPCVIYNKTSSFIQTVGKAGTAGYYNATFSASAFKAAPVCTWSLIQCNADPCACAMNGSSVLATNLSVFCFKTTDGSAQDAALNVTCVGQRK